MFTNRELINLRADTRYKKTNGFCKNFHLPCSIIREKIGVMAESAVSAKFESVPKVFFYLFWLVVRYYFITVEITACRSKIIENLLLTPPIISQDRIIFDSIRPSNKWLERKRNKIQALRDACIEYIGIPEYRAILVAHSHIKVQKRLDQAFIDVRNTIEKIFQLADEQLYNEGIVEALSDGNYHYVLKSPKHLALLQEIYAKNGQEGNLTSIVRETDNKNIPEEDERYDSEVSVA